MAWADKASRSGRLSLLVCTPDRYSKRTVRCLSAIRDTTKGIEYDLVLLDNRNRKDFSHARDMNRAIDMCEGPLCVLDDDVVVSGGWLEHMLYQLAPDVGAVGCSSSNMRGKIRARGCSISGDGEPVLWNGDIDHPIRVPATGSCCLLLNLPVWPSGFRFSLEYKKYFFDPDALLRLWECNLATVIVPDVVLHESGGAMKELHINRDILSGYDKGVFRRKWIDTGRYSSLEAHYGGEWHGPLRKSMYA